MERTHRSKNGDACIGLALAPGLTSYLIRPELRVSVSYRFGPKKAMKATVSVDCDFTQLEASLWK